MSKGKYQNSTLLGARNRGGWSYPLKLEIKFFPFLRSDFDGPRNPATTSMSSPPLIHDDCVSPLRSRWPNSTAKHSPSPSTNPPSQAARTSPTRHHRVGTSDQDGKDPATSRSSPHAHNRRPLPVVLPRIFSHSFYLQRFSSCFSMCSGTPFQHHETLTL